MLQVNQVETVMGKTVVSVPIGARILFVKMVLHKLVIHYLCKPDNKLKPLTVNTVTLDHELDEYKMDKMEYFTTVSNDTFDYHVFFKTQDIIDSFYMRNLPLPEES